MQIRHIFTLIFSLISISVFASIDSTGVENNNGKKLITHKVEPKETYYSLGRKYGVTPKSIMDFNDNKSLQPGMILRIPTDRPFAAEAVASKAPSASGKIISYKVQPKETLYAISQKFNTTVADLRELNDIRGNNLSIGQVIKVRENSESAVTSAPETPTPKPAPASPPASTAPAVQEVVKEEPEEKEAVSTSRTGLNRFGLREHTERGIAIWIDDANVDGSKTLVLHRTAPIGTVMKITNPMTEKSTFAKVVGKFTENENSKDALVVLTKAVADLIGATDKRFQVIIDYGLNE